MAMNMDPLAVADSEWETLPVAPGLLDRDAAMLGIIVDEQRRRGFIPAEQMPVVTERWYNEALRADMEAFHQRPRPIEPADYPIAQSILMKSLEPLVSGQSHHLREPNQTPKSPQGETSMATYTPSETPRRRRWYIRSRIVMFVAKLLRVPMDIHQSYFR